MSNGLINSPELYESTAIPEEKKDELRTSPHNNSDDPLFVQVVNGGGGDGLKCLKDVINLVANTPLTLTFSSIASICSHEFSNSGGNVIYLSADITANQITICSRQDLNNILYKIIGE